jgi:hypothetical protein
MACVLALGALLGGCATKNDAGIVLHKKPDLTKVTPGTPVNKVASLKKPIKPGTEVPVTLIGSKGEQLQFKALAKVFAGANEDYDHSGM